MKVDEYWQIDYTNKDTRKDFDYEKLLRGFGQDIKMFCDLQDELYDILRGFNVNVRYEKYKVSIFEREKVSENNEVIGDKNLLEVHLKIFHKKIQKMLELKQYGSKARILDGYNTNQDLKIAQIQNLVFLYEDLLLSITKLQLESRYYTVDVFFDFNDESLIENMIKLCDEWQQFNISLAQKSLNPPSEDFATILNGSKDYLFYLSINIQSYLLQKIKFEESEDYNALIEFLVKIPGEYLNIEVFLYVFHEVMKKKLGIVKYETTYRVVSSVESEEFMFKSFDLELVLLNSALKDGNVGFFKYIFSNLGANNILHLYFNLSRLKSQYPNLGNSKLSPLVWLYTEKILELYQDIGIAGKESYYKELRERSVIPAPIEGIGLLCVQITSILEIWLDSPLLNEEKRKYIVQNTREIVQTGITYLSLLRSKHGINYQYLLYIKARLEGEGDSDSGHSSAKIPLVPSGGSAI